MSRTWRKSESDYSHSQDYKNRRNKRRQKANSHYEDIASDYERFSRDRNSRNSNQYYDLDTDSD